MALNKLKIRLVEGWKIRNSVDINFAGWGDQSDYFYVPKGEFWVEHNLKREAKKLLRISEFVKRIPSTTTKNQLRAMIKKAFLKHAEPLIFKPKKDLVPRTVNGLNTRQIRLVDGEAVRRFYDPWFVLGGHSLVYDYIPKGEIWIDYRSDRREWPYTIAHEMHEYSLMKKGELYDNAHDFALVVEKRIRRADGVKFWEDAYSRLTLRQLIKTFYIS